MLPVLTFLAYALIAWFSPSPLYPNPKLAVCSTNLAPVGSTVLLYYERNRHSATCKVVGFVADSKGQVFNVSESRSQSTRVQERDGYARLPRRRPDPKLCRKPTAARLQDAACGLQSLRAAAFSGRLPLRSAFVEYLSAGGTRCQVPFSLRA